MSSTDEEAALEFFANYLLPLHYANLQAGRRYLLTDQAQPSYWTKVASRIGGQRQVAAAACSVASLIDELGCYWAMQREPDLSPLLPELKSLHERLTNRRANERTEGPSLPEFVYPLI